MEQVSNGSSQKPIWFRLKMLGTPKCRGQPSFSHCMVKIWGNNKLRVVIPRLVHPHKKNVAYCNCVPNFPTCNSVLSLSLSVFSVYLFNSVSLFFHLGFPLFSWTSPTFLGCLSYLDFPQLALSKHLESIPMCGHSTSSWGKCGKLYPDIPSYTYLSLIGCPLF